MFQIFLSFDRLCGSADHPGLFKTAADAWDRICGPHKTLEPRNYLVRDLDTGVDVPREESPKDRRNRLQRKRRAQPEAKAKEAAASRVSYWRNKAWAAPCFSPQETEAFARLRKERTRLEALRGEG